MGMTEQASAGMSMGLVTLAGDLASFNNMAPEEVLEKLRAGLTGETEPLKSLGVNLNQAMIQARALEMGLWDGIGTIDANAKATASYSFINACGDSIDNIIGRLYYSDDPDNNINGFTDSNSFDERDCPGVTYTYPTDRYYDDYFDWDNYWEYSFNRDGGD